MTNPYFNHDTPLTRHTLGRAEQVNAIFQAVEAGFDKLPNPDVIAEGRVTYVVDEGTANAYAVTLAHNLEDYVEGMSFVMKAGNANTGPATIDVNALGVKQILRFNGAPLMPGDIAAGMLVELGYDGDDFRVLSVHGGEVALARTWATSTTPVPGGGGLKGARGYAQDAAASASAASGSAGNAASSALAAAGSAQDALNHYNAFRGIFYGAAAADPAVDPNGNPPTVGDWYFNTTTNSTRIFNGSTWDDVGAGTLNKFVYTAEGGETSLSGPDDNGRPLAYSVGRAIVKRNGADLIEGQDFTASTGTSIDDLEPLAAGEVVQIVVFSTLSIANIKAENITDVPQEQAAIALRIGAVREDALASELGSELVGFRQAGSVKVQTVAERVGRYEVLATDFENVDPTGTTECAAACQNAINKAIQAGFRTIRFPMTVPSNFGGGYRIGSTLISKDTSGASGPQGEQIAIIGDGKDATTFRPTGDFAAVHIVTSTWESGYFGVTWPNDAVGDRAPTRVGVKFADPDHQVSICDISEITVRNAYRGFVLEPHVGPLGTMWLVTLKRLIAQGCSDWGIHLNSKTGSTTLKFDQVHVNALSNGGKGIYVNNFNEVLGNVAIDQCTNDWMEISNANIVNLEELALESNILNNATLGAVRFNSGVVALQSVKELGCQYNVGAGNTARLVRLLGNVRSARVGGWSEQGNVYTSGSRAKLHLVNANTHCSILDRSVLPSEVLHDGFFANYVFEGRRLSLAALAPSYGTWVRGDFVDNVGPSIQGVPGSQYVVLGWSRLTTGSDNVAGVDWVPVRALTGT